MNDYIEHLDNIGKSTVDTRVRVAAHILPVLGTFQVDNLTSRQISAWHLEVARSAPLVRSKRGKPRKFRIVEISDPEVVRRRRSSSNRILTILKAGLNFAFDEGKVASNEAWGRKVKPFKKVDGVRSRYLTIEEARRLMNACEPDFRLLVRAALETGARYGELTRLKVSDFNPDAATLYISRSKSGKTRYVFLTEDGEAFFREMTFSKDGDQLIFRNEARIERSLQRGDDKDIGDWRASEQNRPMKEAVERAAIKPTISFHGLRHSWASHSVMGGVPLIVVAKNLGHRDTSMVERVYGHLAPSYIVDAIRAGAPRYGIEAKPTNVQRLRAK